MTTSTTETKKQKPAAFIFGKRPETIKGSVEFTSVTGEAVKIECDFTYRTRKEFGEFWDDIADPKLPGLGEGEKFTFARLADHGIEVNADRTLKFLTGWPLDLKVNRENLMEMFDQEPAAASSFWETYRALCVEGRLGNSKPQ